MDAWRGLMMVHALVRAECAEGEEDDGRGTVTFILAPKNSFLV